MADSATNVTITPEYLRERWDVLKPVLQGKKREIANKAGCSVKRVDNAISLQIVSPELLEPIVEAFEEVAREELEKINILTNK